eukprot:Gb_10677 [translate_table: standard]
MPRETANLKWQKMPEEDEEDYEDDNGESRMVGFMFGNVDDFGELDVDYLDEDAKEHLSALANKLGPSLTDLEVSVKGRSGTFSDLVEQEDYDKKAENAVDYEDIEEQYEGPETQAASEEDQVLSKDECFYAEAALAGPSLNLGAPILDEDNYDEEEDYDKEAELMEKHLEPQNVPPTEEQFSSFIEKEISSMEADKENENIDISKEVALSIPPEVNRTTNTPLPVLCKEDGKVVLRFSEIFASREPYKALEKKGFQRYSILSGRHSMLENADILEEDEGSFLKGSYARQFGGRSIDLVRVEYCGKIGDSMEEVDNGNGQEACISSTDQIPWEARKHICLSAQPMKDDENANFLLEYQESFPSPNFYALNQQDWEARVVWESSASVNSLKSGEVDELFAQPHTGQDMDTGGEETPNEHEHCAMDVQTVEERKHTNNLLSYPISVEPFGQKSPVGKMNVLTSRRIHHPQMLRLESRSKTDRSHYLESDVPKNLKGIYGDGIIKHLNKLSLQNTDLQEGSWIERILWEHSENVPRAKLILNLQDDQMLFEILDSKEGRHLRAHAAAMVITRSAKNSSGELGDLSGQAASSMARFNISNDRYYSNRKISQQQKSHTKKRVVHGIKVVHSLPAMRLQTMKPKLSNKNLANFHRPKALWYPHHNEVAAKEQGKLFAQGPMKIIVKTMGGKGTKLHVDAAETLESVKGKAAKKLDFKPSEKIKFLYSGKELQDGKSLAQQGVRPNSVLHLVRTKVHPWPKAQRLPGENKPVRPPGAFKKKSELSVKDGHVFLMEYCEERPLLLGNAGMGARLATYYQKMSPADQTAATLRNESNFVGSVHPLEPTDKSPFLGDIRPGYSQSCLETNMYRAPVFPHKVACTDFLLVRSVKGKLSLRRIDRVHVVGQQEPHMEVLSPGSKNLQSYVGNRLLVYVYREFRAMEKPGCLPRVRADELTAQFSTLSESFLRKRLKHCADLQKGPGGEMLWLMKRSFRIPSEEELRRMVTPENVCAYESMQAGLHHLKRLGINKLTQPAGLASAMNQLPDEAIALAAASHIERELQITSWNLSCNFVASTMQGRECIERLEITGAGDPSGRGLGFSYLRVAPKPPISSALVKKKAAAARGGSAVTGTDADLRRLSMDAAREVLLKFNVDEEQIEKMTRWHRIAMVRKLSSEQAASGVKVDATALNKFARGQRMSFLQLQQQTREKCQEIWDRQFQSLSAADGEDIESDVEANSDLDSFAGDLENLLDAEEGEDGDAGDSAIKKEKRETIRGFGARRRASQAQAEEEIEDEEAEAAELCRMLMDDDEVEEQKKKKGGTSVKQKKDENMTAGNKVDNSKKTKKVYKRIIRQKQPDGTVSSREVIMTDPKEVAKYLAEKNKGKKENGKNVGLKALASKKKKVTVNDSNKVLKGKKQKDKPVRDHFICGACGQSGHMRTNKKCPLYNEDAEVNVEKPEVEHQKLVCASGEDVSTSLGAKSKIKKKPVKGVKQAADVPLDVQKVENVSVDNKLPGKIIPLKFKCGSGNDKVDATAGNESINVDGWDEFGASDQGKKQSPQIKKAKVSKKSKKAKHRDMAPERPGAMLTDIRSMDAQVHKQSSEVEKEHKTPKIVFKQPKGIASEEQRKRLAEVELEREKEREEREYWQKQKLKEEEEERERQIQKEMTEALERHKEKLREDKQRAKDERKLREEREKRRAREEREREAIRLREEEEKQRRKEEEERQRLMDEIRQREEEEMKLREREEFERRERQRARLKQRENMERQREREVREEYGKANKQKRQERRVPERERGVKRRASVDIGRHSTDRGHQAKRRRGGEVLLSNILENIVDRLRNQTDVSYLFLKPVSKKEAPDYFQYVKHPMDLSTIRQKVKRMDYKSRREFRQDVWQIVENAHTYNEGRNPGIPPLADQLLDICDDLLEEHDFELTEAESAVERF